MNSSDGSIVGFVQEPNGRGTFGIMYSCLITWFICLWTIFHINIPAVRQPRWIHLIRKLGFMLFGAVSPEWIAAISYTNWRDARQFVKDARRLHSNFYLPMPYGVSLEDVGVNASLEGSQQISAVVQKFRSLPINNWTLVHGFYCVMGGFVITIPDEKGSNKNGDVTFPLNTKQLLWLIQNRYIDPTSVPVEDIEDKSKTNDLAKYIAILQTLWFSFQFIGRIAQSLPITTLEVSTVGYVTCMLPCMFFWWSKPYDVSVPTVLDIPHCWSPTVRKKLQELSQTRGYSFWRTRNLVEYPRVLNFVIMDDHWIGERRNDKYPNWIAAISTGLVFGGIHCAAWNFQFPTEVEKWLWRASSLVLIYVPLFGIWGYWWRKGRPDRAKSHAFWLSFFNVFYAIVRTYLMVEYFIAFRAMQAGTYDTINWLLYLPNF